ncbi:MAG: hypothetical protein U1A78_38715 [Polyangia bacterium]
MESSAVGRHQVAREAPDLLFVRLDGPIHPDEARALVRADRMIWREHGYSLILIDAQQAGAFDAAARQASFDEIKRYAGYRGTTAVFGLSPYLRILLNLICNALRLLGDQDDEVQCFKDEQDARAFLEARRGVRRQQALSHPPIA